MRSALFYFSAGVLIVTATCPVHSARGADGQSTAQALKTYFDGVRGIDTHSHLRPYRIFREWSEARGGYTLPQLWANTYLSWIVPLPAWPPGSSIEDWWKRAEPVFDTARASSMYRYMLPAFQDLYGVDFNRVSAQQIRHLNDQVMANYRSEKWISEVVQQRAKIDLMLVDPNWARLEMEPAWPFTVHVLNVNTLVKGTHPDQYAAPPMNPKSDSPYVFAQQNGLSIRTLDDYLLVLEAIIKKAIEKGAPALKTTLAYQRSIRFEDVPRARAEAAFGKRPGELTPAAQRDFEDFIFWHLVKLAARYELPFQIHTGDARIQDSNPLLLVDLIAANPKTRFVLFHGGYPWVGETAAIALKHRNVWIDSVWLPTLSSTMARRAYGEWLDTLPADRILWGSDVQTAEGVYGAADLTRRCLAEALAEKVDRGELHLKHAQRIGRLVLRENALALFPRLKMSVEER